MSKEERKHDWILKWKGKHDAMIVVVMLIGMALLVGSLPIIVIASDLQSSEHLTDPDIPVSDLKNATYTFTAKTLSNAWTPIWILFGFGLCIFVLAEFFLIIAPSDQKIHRELCSGSSEPRYCSECGIKLSTLERR